MANKEVISRLNRSAGENAIAAARVAFSVEQINQRLDAQVQAIADIERSATHLAESAQRDGDHVKAAAASASSSRSSSVSGGEALDAAVISIQEVARETRNAMAQLQRLDQQVQQILTVTDSIGLVARQTNLLALNAAVEAARAGEQGRGFAVVASEIRALASVTSDNTSKVTEIVGEIMTENGKVIDSMAVLEAAVQRGDAHVTTVSEQLGDVANQAIRLDEAIGAFAGNNANNLEQLTTLARAVSSVSQEVAGSEAQLEEIGKATQHLMMIAEKTNAELASVSRDNYHYPFFQTASTVANEIGKALERAIKKGRITAGDLFDRKHRPIEGSNPMKYSTAFDALCDELLPDIQEPALAALSGAVFVIACDNKGYVPTHNNAFCQPLTGDYDQDLVGNRTKRIFDDRTGSRCGNHTQTMLLQTYQRDTGEIMHDLSVPIYVEGRHWGGVRVGYHPQQH